MTDDELRNRLTREVLGYKADPVLAKEAARAAMAVVQGRKKWLRVSKKNGMRPETFYNRLACGWTPERAATQPVRPYHKGG